MACARRAPQTKRAAGDDAGPTPKRTKGGLPEFCSCGNKFMEDSLFCRKCGAPRVANTKSDSDYSEREQIGTLLSGARRRLQARVDEALAALNAAKKKLADADADQKLKAGQYKKAVDTVADLTRQLKAAEDRLASASAQMGKADADHAQKKHALDVAKSDLESTDNVYKQHFLPIKTGKEDTKESWEVSSKRHFDALLPKLKEAGCEDCLIAGFKEAAKLKPQDRKSFCNNCVQEVDRLLQKLLGDKKAAVDAATPSCKAAQQALKDATDARDKALAAKKDIADRLKAAEAAEKKAKDALDSANDVQATSNADVSDRTKDHAEKVADVDEFRKKEKDLLDAEAKVDDAIKKNAALEAAKQGALDRKAGTSKDVDRANEALKEAQRKCGQAKLDADKARAAAAEARAKLDAAIAESNRFDDLMKNHFVPLKAGKFKDVKEVDKHMNALRPLFEFVDLEPSLKAGFDAASCHTKDERGAFCSKVVLEVEKCFEKYGVKLKEKIAALRGPVEKADAEAKRLAALQEAACGPAVRDAEALVDKRIAADEEAQKAVDKAQAALDECTSDLLAKVAIRNKILEEVKLAVGA